MEFTSFMVATLAPNGCSCALPETFTAMAA
jgi:hypothetical protein